MKLLFDHNLSSRLVAALRDLYPGSVHVREVELQAVDDEVVWDYAHDHGFVIVSKDAEFHQRSLVLGALLNSFGSAWGTAQQTTFLPCCGVIIPSCARSRQIKTLHFWFLGNC